MTTASDRIRENPQKNQQVEQNNISQDLANRRGWNENFAWIQSTRNHLGRATFKGPRY